MTDNPHARPVSRGIIASFLALAAMGLVSMGIGIATYADSASTNKLQQGQNFNQDIANCKSTLNAAVVLAKADVDDVILDGFIVVAEAAARDGNIDGLLDVVAKIEPVRVRRDAAVDAYEDGVALAKADPGRFLQECWAAG